MLLSNAEIAIVLAVTFAASAVQGAVGFGMNLLAAPFLAVIHPALVPGPLLAAGFFHAIVMSARGIREARLGDVVASTPGRIVGAAIGAWALGYLNASGANIALGSLVLVAVAMSIVGMRVALTPFNLFATGIVAGAMGTISSVGGPPMALLYQDEKGPVVRGVLGAHFLIGSVVSLLALAVAGRFARAELAMTLLVLPGVFAGLIAARPLAAYLDKGRTRPAVYTLAAAAGIWVLVREFL